MFLADYTKDGGAPVRVAVKLIRLPTPPVELEEVTFEADIMLTINHPAILKVGRLWEYWFGSDGTTTDDWYLQRTQAVAHCV